MKGNLSLALIATGALLITSAVLLLGYNLWNDSRAFQSADSVRKQLQIDLLKNMESGEQADDQTGEYIHEESAYDQLPQEIMATQMIDGRSYIGMLEIPALNLVPPLIESLSYEGLQIAPCRFYGSAYTNDLVIAAHNYKAHFGLLHRLSEGDSVLLTDIGGTEHNNKVGCIEKLKPSDMDILKTDRWDLTLFTCTLGGQYRIAVRCMRLL